MRPGGACTACPGFSLSSSTTAHSRLARAITTGNAAGVFHTRRPGTEPRRDAGQGTAPGQPPTIPQAQPDSPARVQSLHSRHRGRTEPRNRARVHEYRQAPPQATEPPTGRKAGNARKSPGQPHRATQRRRGYSHTTTAGKAPQSRPQRRTGASNPQPRHSIAGKAL